MEENEKIKTEVNFNSVNEQNNNSENKPRNKTLTFVLISLIIVLILAIGVCAGLWLAGDTTKTINNKGELVKKEDISKKIDETKPLVYDADYLGEREDKQRTNQYTGEIYKVSKNLVAPYININSEYAKKVNEEILSLYNECYNKFGTATGYDAVTGTQNTDPDVAYILNYLEYEFYETDNILSILITKTDGAVPGGFGKEHYIYNINLKTLNEASFEDVYKECGFKTENEVNKKIDITLTNAKNNDKIFQDTVWDTGMFYMGKNNIFNIIINGNVNRISLEVKTDVVLEQKENETDVTEKIESNQTEKSIFDEANSLKFTSNLTDDINGKIALLKMGENQFKTEIKDGYYMYNAGNYYRPDCHYIKEIKSITSEFCDLNNYKTSALFKCTMKYIDNNNQEKSVELAVIVHKNFNGSLWGNFENYSGSTMFTRQFMDAYYDIATEQEVTEIQEFLNKGENNGFVQINYGEDNASGLKLKSILNAMPDGGESLMNTYLTEQELKEVGVSSEQLHKYDVSKLNGFFYKKIGLTLDRIKNLNTDGMTYSEKYNSYYTNFGDTAYSEVKVTECGKDYYGGIYYVQGECGERKFETELLKTYDGYKFRYNVVKE